MPIYLCSTYADFLRLLCAFTLNVLYITKTLFEDDFLNLNKKLLTVNFADFTLYKKNLQMA